MAILYAGLVLGGIGLVFGLILTFASKAFHVDVDERVERVRACCAGSAARSATCRKRISCFPGAAFGIT